MNDSEGNAIQCAGEEVATGSEVRKPYRKPTFRFEQVFETMALQCGKIAGTSAACNASKMTS